MPDVAASVLMVIPVGLVGDVANPARCIVLVRAQHLQGRVFVIRDGIIPNQLMSHRDIEQFAGHAVPLKYLVIVEVSPMELKFILEQVFTARIGEVERLFGGHGHKYLHHGENAAAEDSFVHVAFQLKHRLRHIHAATLQLHMDNGHTVDEQQHIPSAVARQRIRGSETRLAHNLVTALS